MKITTFALKEEHRAMWEHQNDAMYTGDWVDGVCADSYVMACKRGYCFVYERSKAHGWITWQEYKFAPYEDKEAVDELWREWHEFERDARDYEEWANERSVA